MMLPTNQQTAIVAHPTKAALNLEALLVSFLVGTHGSTALFAPFLGPAARRNAASNATLSQTLSKSPAVISAVSPQPARMGFDLPAATLDRHSLQGLPGQFDFGRRGAVQIKTYRHTVAVHNQHPFGAFAFLGFAYGTSPFLAGTKEPFRKACAHSNLSCDSSEAKTARQMFSQTPAASHALRRRHPVVDEPNSRGRSSQRQPLRSTNNIASKVWRSLALGRPIRFGAGRSGLMTCHCCSLNLFAAPLPKSLSYHWILLK